MLNFSSLEQMVSQACKSASSAGRDGELKPYTKAGGQAGRGWQVVGFYAFDTGDSRLVFEALYYQTPGVCVIRVYRENPLEILFARKWSGDTSRFTLAVAAAADIFRSALPVEPAPNHDADASLDDIPLPAEDRQLIADALKPIPPPCDLDAIEKA
jgi:hypothetical protein